MITLMTTLRPTLVAMLKTHEERYDLTAAAAAIA